MIEVAQQHEDQPGKDERVDQRRHRRLVDDGGENGGDGRAGQQEQDARIVRDEPPGEMDRPPRGEAAQEKGEHRDQSRRVDLGQHSAAGIDVVDAARLERDRRYREDADDRREGRDERQHREDFPRAEDGIADHGARSIESSAAPLERCQLASFDRREAKRLNSPRPGTSTKR